MTRDQAVRRAVQQEIVQGRGFVVVEERFRRHKPTYRVFDLPTWRQMRRIRARGTGYQNWFEVWPGEEAA